MPRLLLFSVFSALLLSSACNSTNHAQTSEDMHRAGEEAKKAGAELNQDVKEVARNIDREVKPDARSASEKLEDGKEKLIRAGDKASLGLSRAALIAEVKSKLASDAGLSTVTNIDVHATGGVVTLTGHVATQAQKDAADHAAALVGGVTRVENDLVVGR
jgi:osmotically-inducible protein OsmY